ncbi:hypothetical protein MLD38_035938 [Melastoma candidum]|uniref:Uncharacterized protein n=1 Tax=Melastoma candidum TaxID=119954 RepID=A0ACB9LK06_9MYRT|nr:hypothetical protein MLD38_035938 [Melastoma candidum]
MKHIFKKLHIGHSSSGTHGPTENLGGGGGTVSSSSSSSTVQTTVTSTSSDPPHHRPSSGPANSTLPQTSGMTSTSVAAMNSPLPSPGGSGGGQLDSRAGDFMMSEEEFQVQLAMAISASNSDYGGEGGGGGDATGRDEMRGANLFGLGGERRRNKDEALAEALSRQYWDYNVLDYEEKVVDGFYDAYALSLESRVGKMPSISDLETNPGTSGFEAIVVNRRIDHALQELLQVAHCISLDCPATEVALLVQRLSELVTGHLGGPVKDANVMWAKWTERSTELRTSLHTSVLPIGSINIGLSRHRALLFKVLADSINLQCRLVKGSHYTGVEDDAVNIIKLADEREFLVDLMAAPGTLIPADIMSSKEIKAYNPQINRAPSIPKVNGLRVVHSKPNPLIDEGGSQGSGMENFFEDRISNSKLPDIFSSYEFGNHDPGIGSSKVSSTGSKMTQLGGYSNAGSSVRQDNPDAESVIEDLIRKHNVVAPEKGARQDGKNYFSELDPFQKNRSGISQVQSSTGNTGKEHKGMKNDLVSGRPPNPSMLNRHPLNEVPRRKEYGYKDGLFTKNSREPNVCDVSSSVAASNTSDRINLDSFKFSNSNPASTGLKLSNNSDPLIRENHHWNPFSESSPMEGCSSSQFETSAPMGQGNRQVWDIGLNYHGHPKDGLQNEAQDPSQNELNYLDTNKLTSDRFMDSNLSSKDYDSSPNSSIGSTYVMVDHSFDDVDVGECEIQWEHLVIGERIGLGSYGEVYRADWNGTEVAVKKFLDQDFSGAALAEFRREVRIMRRLRHPNVVLFMGAVTRPPHLSIISEFLPRGSLYRIIHRPQCQIDEKCRIKMALDVAKGMNCLHSSVPTIVHRDLKSPNLLVDKNWNVKVGDFGLSRLKHNTFLSSKSTAGTPEWMAPEVLRNEPSNEKCDVYSFGVILWELATMKLPWSGMNPMQVVGAVGFQNRRLEIPEEVDPLVARIIFQCWQRDPNQRPSFASLTVALKSLQRLVVPTNLD